MRARTCLAAAAALLALAGCQGMAYREATRSLLLAPPPMDHGLDAQVLPSGLRLAVFKVPGQRDATVSLAMGGGEADEPEGKEGVAWVAVRAATTAPRGRGGASVLERVYAAGALSGFWLNPDEASLAIRYRPAFEEAVVSALADLLEDPAAGVDEEAVRRARAEYASWLEAQAGSGASADLEVRRLALAGTPFGRAGPTPAGVRALTVADVRAFLRASLVPARSVLWFSTGRDAEQEAPRLASLLGPKVAGDPRRPASPEPGYQADPPPARPPTRKASLSGGKHPRILLAWRGPGLRFGPAADRAGGELRARLELRARQDDLSDRVRWVSSRLESFDRASVLYVEVVLHRIEDAELVRWKLLEATRSTSDTWLWPGPAAEANLRRELRLGREWNLADGWVGPVGRLVRAVGSADVPAWLDLNEQSQFGPSARAWLDAWVASGGPAVAAIIAPTPDTAPPADLAPALEGAPPAPSGAARVWATAPNPYATAVPGREQIDRLLAAAGLEEATRERLPSGLEAMVLRRRGAPFVFVVAWLPGGAVRPADALAAEMALEEARVRLRADGCGLAPPAKRYGDGVALLLTGPAAWLPALVEGVACWGQPLAARKVHLPSPDEALPWLAFDAAMTGGPLPAPGGGKDWTSAYLRRLQQTAGAVVVVAGDVEPEAAMAQLREAFGRLSARAAPAAPPPWPRPAARRIILQDVPGARSASASLLLRMPDGRPGLDAQGRVLERLFTDKAKRTLEPAGFEVEAQWVGHGPVELRGLRLEGPPPLLPAAIAELLRELARLRDQGPPSIEVDAARWDAARLLAYRHDAAPGAAFGLLSLATAGLPLDAWNGLGAELRRVDASALQALLRGAAVDAESVLVRGDAATLVPLLQKEGLNPEVLAPPAKAAGAAPAAGAPR